MSITFPVSGFNTVAQNFISRGVASNFYSKSTFLAVLGALTLGKNKKKDMLSIGRPDGGEILTNGMVSEIQRKKLGTVNAYLPRVQGFSTSNTAARTGSGRVTLPDVANKTTASHGQANQFAAQFKWTHVDTPILIWHEDKIRAGQEGTKEGAAIAMGQVIDESTEIASQDQIDWLATKVWTGGGAITQTNDLWDEPLGIVEATKTNNTYANVDRTVTGNSVWQSQVDSTFTAVDAKRLVDDANLTKGLRVKGQGADLILTTTALYQQFKQQVLAGGGVILQNGLPEMAKLGVKKEMLQIDNVLITYDPNCPANSAVVFDTSVWKFMVHPQFNFRVTPFVDNTTTGIAKDAYDYAYIQTRFMLTCDNPFLNVRYSALGT
jgi:hypothetical protein